MDKDIKSTGILLILDVDDVLIDGGNDIIHWNSYTRSKLDRVFSISQIVEEDAASLKAEYLKLIYEIEEAKNNGKSIVILPFLTPVKNRISVD